MTRHIPMDEWVELARACYERALNRTCCACQKMPCRLGMEQSGRPVDDVLCHGCFESAPASFKLSTAQDAFRDAVKAGVEPDLAQVIAADDAFGESS